MAKWLALPTTGHEIPGSNPARAGIRLITVRCFIFQVFNFHPLSRYDLNNNERGINRHSSLFMFVCVEVLRPIQPNGVMSSAVSLPNHTFTVQA